MRGNRIDKRISNAEFTKCVSNVSAMVKNLSLKVSAIEKYLDSNNEEKINELLQRRWRSEDHSSESTDNAGTCDVENEE